MNKGNNGKLQMATEGHGRAFDEPIILYVASQYDDSFDAELGSDVSSASSTIRSVG